MQIQILQRVFLFLIAGIIPFAYAATDQPLFVSPSFNPDSNFISFPFTPRATGWGLGGDRQLGLGDAMAPFTGDYSRIFYADGQGKYSTDTNWYGGLGGGVRQVFQNARILGAYVFIDRSQFENTDTGSTDFWIVSPGIESLGNLWDFRINGYIPVSTQNVNLGTTYTSQTTFVASGHDFGFQQYNQAITTFNDVGPGIDGEIGLLVPGTQLRTYVGGYHFSIQDSDDINGVSGRLEYAFNHSIAFIAADTYDNQIHNSVEVGLRLTLGGIPDDQSGTDIQRRLMDPIPRNLSTLSQGTSVPVVTRQTVVTSSQFTLGGSGTGYYFTTIDGMTFDPALGTANCTIENPCSEPSFNQTTVNDINGFTTDATLFFAPGTYSNFGGQVTINNGQTLLGRTQDYSAPAQGNERALFSGGMSLLGNNLLDSIRILNSLTDGTGAGSQVIALNIQNAPNITLSNDDIEAVATETSDLNGNNFASAIYANNSQVQIQSSTIGATASVAGINNDNNFATGIGGNTSNGSADFTNNTFTLVSSSVGSAASVAGENDGQNFAAGIGGNSNGGSAVFTDNTFMLTSSPVSSTASLVGNNEGDNSAAGIGGNGTSGGITDFTGNTFTLATSGVSSTASVGQENDSFNTAMGIGGSDTFGETADFINNNFTLTSSAVSGTASIVGINTSDNFATGIGGSNIDGTSAAFTGNTFMLSNSSMNGTASVGSDSNINFATGIGGINNSQLGMVSFTNNNFTLTNGSNVTGAASVGGDNNGNNWAAGIGGDANDGIADFTGNTFILTDNTVSGTASIVGNNNNVDGNAALNFATGIGGNAFDNFDNGNDDFTNNTFTLNNSVVSGTASIGGTNDSSGGGPAVNFATGIGGNSFTNAQSAFTGNTFMLTNSSNVSATASIGGDNGDNGGTSNGINLAAGIGGNESSGTANVDFTSNIFTLDSSNVSATASIGGNNNSSGAGPGLNFATGIGGNSTSSGTADFSDNTITFSDGTIGASALIAAVNDGINQAIGVNMNLAGNTVTIDPSTMNVLAQVIGDNTAGTNAATGLNAGAGSTINISNSTVNVTAQANGTNTALATSGAGTINAVNTTFNVTP
jgi:hypothetical protein